MKSKNEQIIPDIERAAVTLLAQETKKYAKYHNLDGLEPEVAEPITAFSAWLKQITTDPDFQEDHIDCPKDVIPYKLIYKARWERVRAGLIHNALWRLGTAIVDFRQRERREGDCTDDVIYGDSPVLRITTSLAAALVEFHNEIVNAIWAGVDIKRESERRENNDVQD